MEIVQIFSFFFQNLFWLLKYISTVAEMHHEVTEIHLRYCNIQTVAEIHVVYGRLTAFWPEIRHFRAHLAFWG